LIILLVNLKSFPAMSEESWTIMTEELPPYNFVQEGVVHGFSTDILLQILHENNISIDRKEIKLLPWPRAYQLVKETPDTILYSTARTGEREELFKWVGPITNITTGLIALKERNILIKNLADLTHYTVGTIRDSAPDQFLLKEGVPEQNLDRIANPDSNIKKLHAGRIDMIVFSVLSTWFLMDKMEINPDTYEVVYTLGSRPLYYAFNRETDDEFIADLNRTLQEMKKPNAEGTSIVEQIINSYL